MKKINKKQRKINNLYDQFKYFYNDNPTRYDKYRVGLFVKIFVLIKCVCDRKLTGSIPGGVFRLFEMRALK